MKDGKSKIEITKYGFIWGGLHIERVCEHGNTKILYLCYGSNEIEISVNKRNFHAVDIVKNIKDIKVYHEQSKDIIK